MRARVAILTFGVSLLALPPAPAQVPAPQPVPYPLNVKPSTPQGTLTGVPVLPTRPAQYLPPPPNSNMFGTGVGVGNGVSLNGTLVMNAAPLKPQTRVFAVADLVNAPLVIPGAAALENTKQAHAHTLMKMIVALTKPESWERGGGAGTIDFIAASDSLCATNLPEVLAEVQKLLDGLRRMQDGMVNLEVHLVTVPAGFGAKAGWPTEVGFKNLTPTEAKKAVEALKAEKRAEMVAQPKLTLIDGYVGTVQTGSGIPFVGLSKGTDAIVQAKTEMVFVGTTLTCTPTIAMDGKSVTLKMSTSQIFPNGKAAVAGPEQTRTAFDTIESDGKVVLLDGSSAIQFIGARDVEQKVEHKVLPRVPYLGRLFKTVGVGSEKREVYQLVTVHIIKDEATLKAVVERDVRKDSPAPSCKSVERIRFESAPPATALTPKEIFGFYSGWFGK